MAQAALSAQERRTCLRTGWCKKQSLSPQVDKSMQLLPFATPLKGMGGCWVAGAQLAASSQVVQALST